MAMANQRYFVYLILTI